ncbi:hypothetical protein DO70_6364 [Burkholderia pseudomallei]|nr:hypothetical protein DO70_6364 [Burkholderia pseudomallei]
MRGAAERAVVRQLDECVIREFAFGAEVRVVVLGPRGAGELPLELGRVRIQQARLADQIEAHVRERDVFFEHRAMPAPFGVALAEDQRVVGEAQHVREMLWGRRHGWPLTCG